MSNSYRAIIIYLDSAYTLDVSRWSNRIFEKDYYMLIHVLACDVTMRVYANIVQLVTTSHTSPMLYGVLIKATFNYITK